jgi:MFS family permease
VTEATDRSGADPLADAPSSGEDPDPDEPEPDPPGPGRRPDRRVQPGPEGTLSRRNLALDLTAAVGVGTSLALVGSLLGPIARQNGLDPLGLAALASAPFVANVLGMLAGRVGPRSPRQLAVLRSSGALLLVALLLVPLPLAMVLVACGYWLSYSLGLPFQFRVWGAIYPSRQRGRLLGILGTGRAAAGGVAVLIAGLVADRLGGVPAMAIGGAFGAICVLAISWLQAPAAANPPRFSARASLQALRSATGMRDAVLAQFFYGGGLIAAVPLYALVQVDRLSLSLGEVGLIGLLSAGATTISYVLWGTLADRRGSRALLGGASLLGFASLLAYAVAPSVAYLWVAAVCGGLASAGMDLGLQAVIIENAESDSRAAVMAGWNAVTGVRGMAAPFLASGLVQAHVLDVAGALLLCAAATGVGTLLYVRMARNAEMAGPLAPIRRRFAALRI